MSKWMLSSAKTNIYYFFLENLKTKIKIKKIKEINVFKHCDFLKLLSSKDNDIYLCTPK